MLKKEFREWLDTTYASQHSIKNPKVLGNYVSRIGRIEREYQRLEADYLDKQTDAVEIECHEKNRRAFRRRKR